MTEHAYATGDFVAQHLRRVYDDGNRAIPLTDAEDADERIQPNGVDIGVNVVERISGRAVFQAPGYDYDKPDRTTLELREEPHTEGAFWRLPPGSYALTYDVEFDIPDGYVGRMYPRSRLMRSGLHLTSALWDQGYNGVGEGMLQVPQGVRPVFIEEGALLAQFTLIEANNAEIQYEGRHQHEGLSQKSEQKQEQSVNIEM